MGQPLLSQESLSQFQKEANAAARAQGVIPTSEIIYFVCAEHKNLNLIVAYISGVLTIVCHHCREVVARIAVAERDVAEIEEPKEGWN